MSGTNTPTVEALPNAIANAQTMLAAMAAKTGTLTDYNPGSIIRQIAESLGAIVEEQGIELNTLVYQAIVYGAYSAFDIFPLPATSATGQVAFLTSFTASPPPATQNISIPSGTIVQTAGGIQFQTASATVLPSGSPSVTIGVVALTSGSVGNVAPSAISQIVNGLSYPLFVANPIATQGGSNAELPTQTAARFAAAVAVPGLASPLAVANAAIGATVSGTGEICQYSTCYEPWISGGTSANNLGFIVYVDNGTGFASTNLLAAVSAQINASPQFRPAGVPWSVAAVGRITAVVGVTGNLYPQYSSQSGIISGAIASGISSYFSSLQFGQTAYQSQIAAAVANSVPGVMASLIITLNTNFQTVTAPATGRIVLTSLNIQVS